MSRRLIWGILLVAVLGLAMPAAALANDLPAGGTFLDDDTNTHEGNIEAIVADGVTFGCDAVGPLYCPNDSVTRAQMGSFLARALDLIPVPGDRFADVSGTHEPNINAIAGAGITLGCNPAGTLYCPNDLVTRAQMASFLVRGLGLPPVAGNRFTDVSGTHTANINALAEAGVTLGCNPAGTLYCPNALVTRAQMASFLARGLGLAPMVPPLGFIGNFEGDDVAGGHLMYEFGPTGSDRKLQISGRIDRSPVLCGRLFGEESPNSFEGIGDRVTAMRAELTAEVVCHTSSGDKPAGPLHVIYDYDPDRDVVSVTVPSAAIPERACLWRTDGGSPADCP